MKTITIVLTIAISGTALSAAYTSAYASRMNGKGSTCSEGTNCMSERYKAATAKPKAPAKSKMVH
jgi:hypothetical protein